jgi:UDP-N-acetylglucosamine--N-acetylmuramyl-(pentapeptide) pyrophosphoryl-undecaprenol N-acetylglucosamine transferase
LPKILVTGGGTGGHVGPAIAIVQALREKDQAIEFLYVGSAAGIEAKLAREAGIAFVGVASGKLRRSSKGLMGMLTLANLKDALRIPLGIFQAFGVVRKFRPDVVLATGGYVSVPPVFAAGMLKIPVLTHEQTVTIGLANKLAGRFATRIALTFEGAMDELPPHLRSRAFVTGNPVRQAIFGGDKEKARARYGFTEANLPCLYITGGAQGSQIINKAVVEAISTLTQHANIIHQCGKGNKVALETARETLPGSQQSRYFLTEFVESDALGDTLALADVMLSRSGAGTVTEVCALGKVAVFVPLVPASKDEQTRNAQRLVDKNAAVILKQSECNGENVVKILLPLLSDGTKRAEMGKNALTLATPNSANDLAEALLGLVKK